MWFSSDMISAIQRQRLTEASRVGAWHRRRRRSPRLAGADSIGEVA